VVSLLVDDVGGGDEDVLVGGGKLFCLLNDGR
jgi:hypothetical protein